MKKVLAAVLVPVLAYGGYLVTMAMPAAERAQEFADRLNRLAEHAEAGAKLLGARGPAAASLHDACKSVVTPVDRFQVAAYFGAPDAKWLAALGNQAHYFPAGQLFAVKAAGTHGWDAKEELKSATPPLKPRGAGAFFEDLLLSPPGEHGWRRNRWNEPFNHPLAEVRYLVVHQLESVSLPRVLDGQSYAPGTAVFHSGFFNASTGERLCDGQTVLAQDGKVEVRGRGKTQEEAETDLARGRDWSVLASFIFDTHPFSLGAVCGVGGAKLCEAAGFPVTAW